jgi:hypothetical protein
MAQIKQYRGKNSAPQQFMKIIEQACSAVDVTYENVLIQMKL